MLERRTRGAFGGISSWIAIALAVGGVGFTFAVADYAKGQRSLPQQRIVDSDACIARVNESQQLMSDDKLKLIEACVKQASTALGVTTTTSTETTGTATTPPTIPRLPAAESRT